MERIIKILVIYLLLINQLFAGTNREIKAGTGAGLDFYVDGTDLAFQIDNLSSIYFPNFTTQYVPYFGASGVLSQEQYLSKARGGSAQNNSSLTFPASGSLLTNTLADTKIIIGSGDGSGYAQSITGDISIANTGVAAIGSGVIVNADINANALIDAGKIGSGSGQISNTEYSYLDGVTSNIQTQIDNKVDEGSGSSTNQRLDTPILYGSGSNGGTVGNVWKSNGSGSGGEWGIAGGAGGENFLSDGGFEGGLNFTCNHANQTCAQGTSPNYDVLGTHTFKIDASASSTYDAEYCVTNTEWAGNNFEVGCVLNTTSTLINLCASDDSGSGDNCVDYVPNTSSLWLPIQATMVVPASGKACVRITSDSGTTDDVYGDSCYIRNLKTQAISKVYEQYVEQSFDPASMTSATSGTIRFGTITFAGNTLLTYTDANGRFTNNTTSNIKTEVHFTARSTVAGSTYEISVNGTVVNRENSSGASEWATVSTVVNLAPSEYIEIITNATLTNGVTQWLTIGASQVIQDQVLTSPSPQVAEIKFYNQTGCSALIDGASFQDLADAADCLFSTATKTPNVITPTTSGALALKQTLVAKGSYDVSFSGTMFASNFATQDCAFRLTDGTNIIGPIHAAADGTSVNSFTSGASGTVTYTSDQANLEWKLQAYEATNAGGSCYAVGNDTQNSITIKMVPTASTMVASLKNSRYYEATGQGNVSLASSVFERSQYDTEVFDPDNSITTGASWLFTSRRKQVCSIVSRWGHDDSGSILYAVDQYQSMSVFKNSVETDTCINNSNQVGAETDVGYKRINCPFQITLDAGDNFYLAMLQNSGETATLINSVLQSNFKMICHDY